MLGWNGAAPISAAQAFKSAALGYPSTYLRASVAQWRLSLVNRGDAVVVVAKVQAVLTERELLWTMFDVGYFPPNTPPGE
jgi:hypothetical protein